jgi:hypothetical protein
MVAVRRKLEERRLSFERDRGRRHHDDGKSGWQRLRERRWWQREIGETPRRRARDWPIVGGDRIARERREGDDDEKPAHHRAMP